MNFFHSFNHKMMVTVINDDRGHGYENNDNKFDLDDMGIT